MHDKSLCPRERPPILDMGGCLDGTGAQVMNNGDINAAGFGLEDSHARGI